MGVRHRRSLSTGCSLPESFLTDSGTDLVAKLLESAGGRMLTVEQALEAILAETRPLEPVVVELADALGLVSAEEAFADAYSPPFSTRR